MTISEGRAMQRDRVIRQYRPGDEDGITSLFQSIYGVPMSREEWRWKYAGFATGDPIIVVAVADGRIVGHVSSIPCRMAIDGSPVSAHTAVDAMVASDWRGRGVFLEMEDHLTETFRGSGAKVLFSFANRASGGILTSHGIRVRICEVESLTRIIRPFAALANRVRTRAGRQPAGGKPAPVPELPAFPATERGNVTFEEAAGVGPEMDGFWHATCSLHRVSVWRDAAYLTWRYIDHPARSYRIVLVRTGGEVCGYFVLGTIDVGFRKGFLVDLVLREEHEDTIETVAGLTIDYFRKAGIESVGTWLPGHSRPSAVLRRNGFSRRDAEVTITGISTDRTVDEVFFDATSWYYCAGDSDVL